MPRRLPLFARTDWLAHSRQAAAFLLPWQNATAPDQSARASAQRLQPQLASAFTKSVYDALLQQQTVGTECVAMRFIMVGLQVVETSAVASSDTW